LVLVKPDSATEMEGATVSDCASRIFGTASIAPVAGGPPGLHN
jgi:hypothetical protein